MSNKIIKIAVLMACHNRKAKTLNCLKSLYETSIPKAISFDVYLVDDASTDQTTEAVKKHFPQVNVIQGNGNLFWNQGMRLAWDTAVQKDDYDFYLWLNDDTFLFEFGLSELIECYDESYRKDKIPSIIAGACQASSDSSEFSYGGWMGKEPVVPNGELQRCTYINGNATIVPKAIYERLGNLSPDYTHAIGDSDYGLRAIRAGFNCYTSRKYIATCPTHESISAWCNPNISFAERWKSLHSTKGLNIKEYNIFLRKFCGWKWIISAFKVYMKTLDPRLYSKISKKN